MSGKIIKWVLLFFGALAVQSTLMDVVSILGVSADLPFIVLFFFAVRYGMMPGLYVGFFLGLCQDLYTPEAMLGQNALAKTVGGFFMGIFNERVVRTDPILKMVILLLAFLVHDVLILVTEVANSDASLGTMAATLLTNTLGRSLYSVLVAALVYLWEHFTASSLHS